MVGRIGRPHGVRGEVTVEVRTDSPDVRFAPGTALVTESSKSDVPGQLTVLNAHWHSGTLLVAFDGVNDRGAAEGIRGTLLVIDAADAISATDDPDEFHDVQLIGLHAEDTSGAALGVIEEVLHTPAGELLSLRRTDGGETLVPFIQQMVPIVDTDGGRIVIDPPEGLLDL